MRKLVNVLIIAGLSFVLAACTDASESVTTAEHQEARQQPGNGDNQSVDDKGQFKDDRVWPGLADGKCGARLMVVGADGSQTEYWPPEKLFGQFEQDVIVQNETPRPAAKLSAVLAFHGASRMRLQACDGGELSLDKVTIEEWPGFLVLSGRGPIKLVKEQDGKYITMLRMVRKIEFFADAGESDASAGSEAIQ